MFAGLTAEQSQAAEDVLSELLVRAEADAVFLCNRGGYILVDSTVEEYEQNDNIAALAAGSFFATREIARLIGEPEFKSVCHQGDRKSIYMKNTGLDLLVVVVFGAESNAGLVRLCVDETCAALDDMFVDDENLEAMQTQLQDLSLDVKTDENPFGRA